MQLNQLQPSTKPKRKKRVGRSGPHGKTSGRGTKGQKARAGHRIRPEIRDIIKKLPKLRGRGKHVNKSIEGSSTPVNLEVLERAFNAGEEVNPHSLVSHSVISARGGRMPRVKVLGKGKLTKKLIVSGCLVSNSAKESIEKVGGSVIQ
jgi:large subunit ribosomal protein L15